MDVNLSRRLAAACDRGRATIEERQQIVDAAQDAEHFSDLPSAVRRLVQQLEARP